MWLEYAEDRIQSLRGWVGFGPWVKAYAIWFLLPLSGQALGSGYLLVLR